MWNNGSNSQNDFLLSLNGQQNGTNASASGRPNDLANLSQHLFQQQQRQNQGIEGLLQDRGFAGGLQSLQQLGGASAGTTGGMSTMGLSPMTIQKYNLPQQEVQPKVKVKCESCGVLLEVVVPPNHPNPTIIVRCGSCSSLLEVLLNNNTITASAQQQQSAAGNGGVYGLPSMGGLPGQLENMSYLQQSKNPLNRYGANMALSPHGQMQNSPGPSVPFNQYNMLHHPHISFENMRGPASDIQEMQRNQNILMLRNYTGEMQNNKRGHGHFDAELGLHHLRPQGHQGKAKRRKKDPNKPKKLSLYNKYVSQEVHRLKKSDQKFSYKDMFKIAAASWKTSPMNPKNQMGPNGKHHQNNLAAAENVLELNLHYPEGEDSLITVELKYAVDNNLEAPPTEPTQTAVSEEPPAPAPAPAQASASPTQFEPKVEELDQEEQVKEEDETDQKVETDINVNHTETTITGTTAT